jgi:FHA domain
MVMLNLESSSCENERHNYPLPPPALAVESSAEPSFGEAAEAPSDDYLLTVEGPIGFLDLAPAEPAAIKAYVQATIADRQAFLTTNLPSPGTAQTTESGQAWLIGRGRNCAVLIQDTAISRCHAVIGHDQQHGFYLMDVGSSNGTFLNQRRLVKLKRHPLRDGDVIGLSHIRVEFFLVEEE